MFQVSHYDSFPATPKIEEKQVSAFAGSNVIIEELYGTAKYLAGWNLPSDTATMPYLQVLLS